MHLDLRADVMLHTAITISLVLCAIRIVHVLQYIVAVFLHTWHLNKAFLLAPVAVFLLLAYLGCSVSRTIS